jgi:hypothetical protein
VQNPTQVPAPVNPAIDPEVSPPPNDVDPNFIPNPAPVNPAADPEVPPTPSAEFGGGKRFDAEPVAPAANPEVPQPANEQNLFVDTPTPVNFFVDEQVPQVQNEQNFFTDAAPAPVENYFTDETPIVQNYFTDATPVSPAANPEVPQPTIVQNYFTDTATPVTPTTNSQVPQAPIQNIFDLIANLFSRTPTTVAPTVNPQVAQPIPVPPPATITAVPIPPVSNPQVPEPPVVQNYFTDRTPTPVVPAANPQVPEPPIVQNYFTDATPAPVENYFTDETPIVQNYFTDATPAPVENYFTDETPIVQNYFTDATPAPVENYFTDAVPVPTENYFTDAAPVSPAANPSVPQSDTRIDGPVNQATFQQANPAAATDYKSYVVDTQNKIVEQQTRELEATQGFPASENQIAVINGAAFGTATVAADIKFKDQIQAADAAQSVPVNTPPPTVAPAPAEGFGPPPNDADPNFISNPAPVSNAIDPEVPQPTAEFGGGKRFAPEAVDTFGPPPNDVDPNYIPNAAPVVPTVNPQTPQLTNEQNLFVDTPTPVNFFVDEQVPQPQLTNEQNLFVDTPTPVNFFVDEQVPQPQLTNEQNLFVDTPAPVNFFVDEQVPQPDSFPEEGIDRPAPVESPSPYERFLAQEAAATDAAQAEATARFNAQFEDGGNIIGSSDDPQVNQGGVTDVGEFQAELPPIPDIDTGYGDFYGIEDDVGEFQAEPVDIPNIDTGYEDFYGNEEDVGEFQAEPVDIPDIDTGYDDFYGNEEDVGEFQDLTLEPDAVDSDDTGFGNFSDTGGDGGDFFGGLFGSTKRSAGAVSGGTDPLAGILDGLFGDGPTKPNPKTTLSPQQIAANKEKQAKALAKQQNIINQQRKQVNDGDWRVRLRLAGSADYLYNAPSPGILAPLSKSGSDGVIFPYTPQITTAYQAKYNAYELTHSNYKGYFYQGSSVGDISINATFTAQDTKEANYLLAVIHFFRSVTKMFYGQDDSAHRGAPPPLVFLQGLGEYQFNRHPCVVTNFNYTLPADVDYIRALSPNNDGTNLSNRRSLQSGVTPFINPSSSRLQNAGLPQGGLYTPPAPPSLGTNSPTYVPTKMDIQLTLLAIQTRSQVSKQFSLKGFANGNLIKGGFW